MTGNLRKTWNGINSLGCQGWFRKGHDVEGRKLSVWSLRQDVSCFLVSARSPVPLITREDSGVSISKCSSPVWDLTLLLHLCLAWGGLCHALPRLTLMVSDHSLSITEPQDWEKPPKFNYPMSAWILHTTLLIIGFCFVLFCLSLNTSDVGVFLSPPV